MDHLIVGLGASAGGLDAFKTFFTHMPPDSGLAFVLVQHLDPKHKSLLVELLGKHTAMPVAQAEDGMAVAADHVFVIPPNATLLIKDGRLRLTTPAPPREQRRPIDSFFASLAEDQEENAVCVILSGTGSDGTQGLKAIKEHGGLTMAQAGGGDSALQGMPSSAAATGLVDDVLPVEDMPNRLIEYAKHLGEVGGKKGADGIRSDAAEHLSKICTLLRTRLGHDFSQYKEKTLVRRIQRRMQVLQIDTVPAYIERLRKEPAQLELLFCDLLIGVTEFFRDQAAFAALQSEVIPKLLEGKGADDLIRVWVPGCATGEEAYSIAILLKEAMAGAEAAPRVQIFATDLDEQAVAVARHGRYRKPLSGISPERLRWFGEDGDDYAVVKEIREMCVCSVHNVVRDPPFSKLDLISCRNLMIYLNGDLQNRLVRTFHYALRPQGWLFLGGSESVGRQGEFFTVVDKKHRLFQRHDETATALPRFAPAEGAPARPAPAAAPARRGTDERIAQQARRALERHSPAYVVIDPQHDIVQFSGRTSPYVEPPAGAASLNLFHNLRRDLQGPAREAVRQAIATHQPVIRNDVAVAGNGNRRIVDLIVEPLPQDGGAALHVVAFHDRGAFGAGPAEAGAGADEQLQALEKENLSLRAQLEAMTDEVETNSEELKSANEEYQSVNEELQSSNEELETSKEELTSINEELQTINNELNSKNEALTRANSDIRNLLDSTQIATLFLDGELRIRTFTPAMSEIFHLRDGDKGRPITEIVTRLSYADMKRDVKKVLRSLSMIEHEVGGGDDGTTFLMRIRPYRTVGDVIDGVVITFVDISERKRHEAERARLAAMVDSSQDAIIVHSLDGTIATWNSGAERMFGYPAREAVGKKLSMLLPPDRHDEVPDILRRLTRGEGVAPIEIVQVAKSGKQFDISMTISPVRDEHGRMVEASAIARDITERRHADEVRALMVNELNHRVKNTLATVQAIAARSLGKGADGKGLETFNARLVALARAHDVLARESWEGASLRELVGQELAPYQSEDGSRVVLDGADFGLRPKAALALGLAFHELATNAAKYGALSQAGGQVHVHWEVMTASGPHALRLRWEETGGPPVEKTDRKGFGSTLIERGLALELGGKVRIDLAPGGLVCAIEIPLPAGGGGRD